MGQVLNISYLPSMTSTPLRAGHHREPVRRPSGRRSGGSDLAVFGTEVPTRGCQLEYFGHGPSISAKYLLEYFGHGPSILIKSASRARATPKRPSFGGLGPHGTRHRVADPGVPASVLRPRAKYICQVFIRVRTSVMGQAYI
jgi:hypothetical protein